MRTTTTILLLLTTLACVACQQPARDAGYLSEERRVWVVRRAMNKDTEVYRCADGAGPDQPPKPICVKAVLRGGDDD